VIFSSQLANRCCWFTTVGLNNPSGSYSASPPTKVMLRRNSGSSWMAQVRIDSSLVCTARHNLRSRALRLERWYGEVHLSSQAFQHCSYFHSSLRACHSTCASLSRRTELMQSGLSAVQEVAADRNHGEPSYAASFLMTLSALRTRSPRTWLTSRPPGRSISNALGKVVDPVRHNHFRARIGCDVRSLQSVFRSVCSFTYYPM